MEKKFTQRIGFSGDLEEISKIICRDFNLGEFVSYKIILIGYEDFNFSLNTSNGKFFVKIFANIRTLDDCKRNIEIMTKVFDTGVCIPKLYRSNQGYLHILDINQSKLRLCVMDFIDAKDYFSSNTQIIKDDILNIARQASLINSIKIRPNKIYDSWAIVNFLEEFEEKNQYLNSENFNLIKPLIMEYQNLKINKLPHCFVHGDLVKINIIKDNNNKIWIIDFSVSNYYPRIHEIAVLACDILFDENDAKLTKKNLKIALNEYQKNIRLTPRELEILPIYIKLAHAMHLLEASFEKKIKKNNYKENEYLLNIGKLGLTQE